MKRLAFLPLRSNAAGGEWRPQRCKLPVLSVALLASVVVSPALANGPQMMDPPQTNTQNDPARQRWVQRRIEQLERNREHYENERFRAKLLMNPIGGQLSDIPDVMRFKAWEAQTAPERRRERVETLMLKRENGTITPAENRALNKWIRQHQHR